MSERVLSIVPIVHDEADLGGLAEHVRESVIDRVGRHAWQDRRRAVEAVWDQVESWAEAFGLDRRLSATAISGVRLYQDALPVCGRETDIVRDMAAAGSRNHQLLQRMIDRGAELVGTESPQLLIEEYELVKRTVAGEPGLGRQQADVLRRRDAFIADRILSTLPVGRRGVLFIGMLHDVEHALRTARDAAPADPVIEYPFGRPRATRVA